MLFQGLLIVFQNRVIWIFLKFSLMKENFMIFQNNINILSANVDIHIETNIFDERLL